MRGASKLKVPLSDLQAEKLLQYLDVLLKWNKVHNLCANATYDHMVAYHLLDSISVAGSINCRGKNIIDIGTGAGFPGIPLAIAEPSCKVTLLDSKAKKIAFLNHVVNALSLNNIEVQLSRVENYLPLQPNVGFDLVISRAFASLKNFVNLSARLCAPSGKIVAMKSDPDEFKLDTFIYDNYKIIDIKHLQIPGVAAKRSLVVVGYFKDPAIVSQQAQAGLQ